MKPLRRIFLCALLGCAAPCEAVQYVNEFLALGTGSRDLSFGPSFVAIADDSSAMYWNPAGLIQIPRYQLEGMYRRRFGLVQEQMVGMVMPYRKNVVGVSFFQSQVGDIPVTAALKDEEVNQFQFGGALPKVTGTSSNQDRAFFLSFARRITYNLSLGLGATLVDRDFLGMLGGFGYGLDLGALLRLGPVMLGLSSANLVQNLEWSGRLPSGRSLNFSEKAPTEFRFGVAYALPFAEGRNGLVVALGNKWDSNGREPQPQLGVELCYQALRIRGGISSNLSSNGIQKAGAQVLPSFGFGAGWRATEFQYGLTSHPLGLTHAISWAFRFGTPGRHLSDVAQQSKPMGFREPWGE